MAKHVQCWKSRPSEVNVDVDVDGGGGRGVYSVSQAFKTDTYVHPTVFLQTSNYVSALLQWLND